ncbi:hypothetical protein RclHR1_17600002 [Rhizophagus clarus]|uniref:Uncharacterized protein n=1 Tax=Rhizophagus clarus TaxID=94130 RepID=A0A2Z6QXV1_9GLOM|nr:hypothetical protein RclHR1_17600002 [Rhizophagus clarus]GES93325.1 hypothetical protein RCL_e5278_RclHR1_17600002 [Rhizophagus clarus]
MTNLYKGHTRDPYPLLSGSSAKLLGSWYESTWLKFNADLLAGQIEPMFSIPPYGLIGERVSFTNTLGEPTPYIRTLTIFVHE